jgi:adenine-specific DNA methylase
VGDNPMLRKARGAFFTPPDLTRFLAGWAIRSGHDRVFEPSCGEAAFLVATAERLRSLGADGDVLSGQLHGVEIHAESASAAASRVGALGASVAIETADFFDIDARPDFDAVVGNPPYIRYQHFSGSVRAKSLQAALAQGVRLSGLASCWAAFVIHAAQFLRPDGRLGLVLPAELLTVNYAAPVRRFLLQRFAKVRLVLFEDLVFPGALTDVVLLLAEGTGGAQHFEVCQVRNRADLAAIDPGTWVGFAPRDGAKWTPALLPAPSFSTYQELIDGRRFGELIDWGTTYLGAVTGNNKYFTLSQSEIELNGLGKADLIRISPPGSKHLRGLRPCLQSD